MWERLISLTEQLQKIPAALQPSVSRSAPPALEASHRARSGRRAAGEKHHSEETRRPPRQVTGSRRTARPGGSACPRRAQNACCPPPQTHHLSPLRRETSHRSQRRNSLHNHRSACLRIVKVIKKESLRNFHSREDPRRTAAIRNVSRRV